ncbi:riboflavin biosynthesis protein RibBA [Variibacter gotjawalensis]|uniref:3,4-dihydroxy-2-butanone 4-phosphate synthase n=2 Tax=Variibacter gotjawalensis TaxID=1333996 RepID=A0A0S3PR05_9BRAD|nr:3,4-dihydroxy 2-butanone 4-phosphate synthase/GTP cyclohydrolase II [Variibacter gotjawalensis]RZS50527.1 3,4-dihydroxy 2-butanone 4-phosphate synthase/GTP cyclohydrolase II [Variibacter gotjawalensis]BAT58362.1 riboflavin biosynthesis protein RibBA [Variibacter gotjawalensis]
MARDTEVMDVQTNVQTVIEAFARGEIVIVTDDDDRENEGDLVLAAVHATPDKMAFIIRNTCGIVCTPLPIETARRLNLTPMVAENDSAHTTAFTITVDYRHGTTTGISAEDRTATVRNLANPNAGASDFSRPGHIFPLIAKEGGVLMRSGHTEAAVDLCRYAKLEPVGVICELVNDDGTVMRGPQIEAFAQKHKMHRISVADLIAYRQAREKLVERVSEFPLVSDIGPLQGYAYVTPFDKVHHMAFVYGRIGDGRSVPARLHRAHVVSDVFGGGRTIKAALQRFKQEGRGVLVYLRDGAVGVPTKDAAADARSEEAVRHRQWREIGLGAQILRDLGISSIRNLASANTTYVGLGGFGIEIESTEPLE